MAKFPTYDQMAKDVAEKALDEILYNGKSIREWMKIIAEQEPRTGRWIEDENEMKVRCSECGEDNDECSKFCPNCGAKMEANDD